MKDTTPETAPGVAPPEASTRRPTVPALDAMIGTPLPVLDHGFVQLVDYMGDDQAIVQAARVSYGRGTRRAREDRGLIRYLLRHHHTTPFEMCEIKVHVKLPIFVARQWIRHRTACLTGDSRLVFDVCRDGRTTRRTISLQRLHALWNRGSANLSRARIRKVRLRMCDEATGEIRSTRIKDIWSTGTKPVFRVGLANGYGLTMTKDHRCLTESGWLTLEQASSLRLDPDGGISWASNSPALAVNGIIASPRAETSRRRLVLTWSRIVSIEYAGEQPTYDVAVEGPYHNFVANGFIVHNSVNEYSARYSILDREFYVPTPALLAGQSSSNRQGRGDAVSPQRAKHVLDLLKQDAELTYAHYEDMLGGAAETQKTGEQRGEETEGIARELARINLPVSFYTQWYWKIDLHNLLRFIALRADPHAQHEIRVYAEALAGLTKLWVPDVYEAFVDYQLEGASLSRMEVEALKRLLRGETPDLNALGLSAREQVEFKQRFDLT